MHVQNGSTRNGRGASMAIPFPTNFLRVAQPGSLKLEWYEFLPDHTAEGDHRFQVIKRLMDVVSALVSLPFVLPILIVCAVAICLDSRGGPFFTQRRTGLGGKRFTMFKLRTMHRNAEELKQLHSHLNELQWPDFKITNDPRITRIGKWLRRSSLDELPQVFNVLLGDMSLVGPRPTSFSSKNYRLWHTARLESRPGLTGLWQVCGRNELEFDDRVRLDIAYHRNQCFRLDLWILGRTVGAVFTGRGAA